MRRRQSGIENPGLEVEVIAARSGITQASEVGRPVVFATVGMDSAAQRVVIMDADSSKNCGVVGGARLAHPGNMILPGLSTGRAPAARTGVAAAGRKIRFLDRGNDLTTGCPTGRSRQPGAQADVREAVGLAGADVSVRCGRRVPRSAGRCSRPRRAVRSNRCHAPARSESDSPRIRTARSPRCSGANTAAITRRSHGGPNIQRMRSRWSTPPRSEPPQPGRP